MNNYAPQSLNLEMANTLKGDMQKLLPVYDFIHNAKLDKDKYEVHLYILLWTMNACEQSIKAYLMSINDIKKKELLLSKAKNEISMESIE